MKLKHNKKRNTAFLYETLIRELTESIVTSKKEKKQNVIKILKEYFSHNSILSKELSLYKMLLESKEMSEKSAEKLLTEVKKQHNALDQELLFERQSTLIKRINKELNKEVFLRFLPDYKSLATVNQVFDTNLNAKKRIVLEENLVSMMSKDSKINGEQDKKIPTDKLVMRNFLKEFNSTYSNNLIKEQKTLLNHYITSFVDNGAHLKIFLNEEISRLKNEIDSQRAAAIDNDSFNKLQNVFESFKKQEITSDMIMKVLKIQNLVKEIQKDGN